ncbi:sensor histidine kinase [Solimonas sp. K1W22B-7]|uniref:sensor histidine kinase n=1 Tax=Solimonas sp. K1W22B-7 TaxID=2303331 RepID=UPI000E32E332|nr:HAMP domain-containing sensor histidine kinase [Solimonas sp. K1W22B-7]AXQ30134.1 sensor histidine kinase [Solimonas sp. K1W22B-7]
MSPLYVHVALTLALVESLGLGVLLLRLRGVAGLRLLVLFLFGVAAWVLACELPTWFGPGAIPAGMALASLSPLTSAVYLHFVLVLCGTRRPPVLLAAIYALGGLTCLLALWLPPGSYQRWEGFEYFFLPTAMGWVVGWTWALLAIAGHAVLFWHWLVRRGPPRGQLVAMCLASGWGLMCMSAYGFASFGIELYPFPLLLLPLYPVILVYGILRYELMIVNAWARRGLAWALTVGLGSAALIALSTLPLPFGAPRSGWGLWAVAVATLLASGLLLDPFRRLATRLVYPGSHLGEGDVERWRAQLQPAESYDALAQAAASILSAQLRIGIEVTVNPDAAMADSGVPALRCRREGGRWQSTMRGWDAAPPGPRHVAQLFGTILAERAQQLEQALGLALREREQQQQERLAELGALAATVAHDIRNPLNIINMAATMAAPELRSEILAQTSRISQLAADLLDYARSWQVELRPLDLSDYVRALAAPYAAVAMGEGLDAPLPVHADPRRLQQVLLNLFDNARAAIAGIDGGRVVVEARRPDARTLELAICDNGSGVPPEIRDSLFQPFVSRRPDGTGLGLAIVARIMQAHGGDVGLQAREGWSTCFVLSFPVEPSS